MAQFYSEEQEIKPKHHIGCSNSPMEGRPVPSVSLLQTSHGCFLICDLLLNTHEIKERKNQEDSI